MKGLQDMLNASPQGTMILTADLSETRRILDGLDGQLPDVFFGSMPGDARAFNAVCAYPTDDAPVHYRRIVLAGMPECVNVPEGAEVYRLEADAPWMRGLPDVNQMREVYKAVRGMSWKARSEDDRFRDLAYAVHRTTGLSEIICAASLLALNDMQLVQLSLNPLQLNKVPMRKTEPDSNAVWRAVQRWRNSR